MAILRAIHGSDERAIEGIRIDLERRNQIAARLHTHVTGCTDPECEFCAAESNEVPHEQ